MNTKPQYGSTHRRVRAVYATLLPLPCVFCGRPIQPGQPFHLDHLPGTLDRYRGVACPSCNSRDGAHRRNHRARGKPKGWQQMLNLNLRDTTAGLDLAWDRSRTSLVVAGHADHPKPVPSSPPGYTPSTP
ncbi:MAG: hypothetical protein HZY75_11970 [Nocardioidaceae bacterium]|nr:MAG: hypothetical protein HZY75_11970 [Nocardioidaceae bacterium]